MTVFVDKYKASLAQKVEDAARFGVLGIKPSPDWFKLYLLRMNIVVLERNNELDILSEEEVGVLVSNLDINLT